MVVQHQNCYECSTTYHVCHEEFLHANFLQRVFFLLYVLFLFFFINAKEFTAIRVSFAQSRR